MRVRKEALALLLRVWVPSHLLASLGLGFQGEVTLSSFLAVPCPGCVGSDLGIG